MGVGKYANTPTRILYGTIGNVIRPLWLRHGMTHDTYLTIHDLHQEISKRLAQPVDRSVRALRNLMIVYTGYLNYLEVIMKRGRIVPGIPIFISDIDLRLERAEIGTQSFTRDWFKERPGGGTETKWIDPWNEEGFQWWIMTWKWAHGLLSLRVSHWIIQRDEALKRNTIYLSRSYDFDESDRPDNVYTLVQSNTAQRLVPQSHRNLTKVNAKHALRHETDDWVTILSPYGIFEIRNDMDALIRTFDMSGLHEWYLDRKFKQYWLMRVRDALYPSDEGRTTKWPPIEKIDDDGLLKDTWYRPNISHFLDKESFVKVRDHFMEEVVKYKAWYERFLAVLHGKSVLPEIPEWGTKTNVT